MNIQEREYKLKIASLENKITQLNQDIKDNDKEDSKRRNVVLAIIGGCFVLHTIGLVIHPYVVIAALSILLVDVITGWIVLSKFENKDIDLKQELKETEKALEEAKEEYENFLEQEYRHYSIPESRINPTVVNTPLQNTSNKKDTSKNNNRK